MTKRLLFFTYGLACYVVFLATFLYAIAFVGGFAVPRRLDGPLEGSLLAAIAIDCALLMVFAVQHSVMARRWFKERWTQIIPWTIERSTYVLCASLALLLVFWQWRPIGIEIWTVEHAGASALLWAVFAAGWATVLVVTFLINHFDLFGLRQVWLPLVGQTVHARVVPHAPAVPAGAPPTLLWIPARVLGDAAYDAGAPRIRGRDDGVHRACNPVRGARPRRRARRHVPGLPAQGTDAGARPAAAAAQGKAHRKSAGCVTWCRVANSQLATFLDVRRESDWSRLRCGRRHQCSNRAVNLLELLARPGIECRY